MGLDKARHVPVDAGVGRAAPATALPEFARDLPMLRESDDLLSTFRMTT